MTPLFWKKKTNDEKGPICKNWFRRGSCGCHLCPPLLPCCTGYSGYNRSHKNVVHTLESKLKLLKLKRKKKKTITRVVFWSVVVMLRVSASRVWDDQTRTWITSRWIHSYWVTTSWWTKISTLTTWTASASRTLCSRTPPASRNRYAIRYADCQV